MAGILSVSDIFTRVQRTFGDEAGVQVTESDVLRWINDAQREAVMQTDGLLQAVSYINSVSSQVEYDEPTDCLAITEVYVKDGSTPSYYALKWMPLQQFTEYLDGWDGSAITGNYPLVYTKLTSGKISVFPAPEASVANGIKFIYNRYAADVTNNNDPLDLPPYYHSFVLNFCLMQAYEMDEDWESAGQKAQQIQGDLNFNANRELWVGKNKYPTIGVNAEDSSDG